ncbi:MAG TPA: glycosyltransferase [Candidatus Saccharimonadales bacterium]|nr:glycosyltransferase [Candidatus Saccharimonadales bacterium]
MASKHPLISVIMPVYNNDEYIKQAIDSILEQTYPHFELIALDDGSSDTSGAILDGYARTDNRVRVVHKKNEGLVKTLNRGIDMAKGEFIARMDGDDISFPRRFEQQIKILQNYPNVVLVAGGFEIIDEEGEFLYREVIPTGNDDIKRSMLLRNPVAHGSVMFRKSAYEKVGPYSDACGPTEDFELWSRLATVGDFAGLEQTIFRWRVNLKGITRTKNDLVVGIMKRHMDALWASNFPKVRSAKDLRTNGRHYFMTYKKRGMDMKRIVLADNASIAIKMIARGHIIIGVHQWFAVAMANRSGIKAAIHRVRLTIKGKTSALRRYAKFGRQEV